MAARKIVYRDGIQLLVTTPFPFGLLMISVSLCSDGEQKSQAFSSYKTVSVSSDELVLTVLMLIPEEREFFMPEESTLVIIKQVHHIKPRKPPQQPLLLF